MSQDLTTDLTTVLNEMCGYEWLCLYRTKEELLWCPEGCEGFFGLQLIADSVAKEFGYSETTEEETVPTQDVEFEEKLNAMKAIEDMSFIAYYRLPGSPSCHVAWSDHLDPDDVFQETIGFIQCGIILER